MYRQGVILNAIMLTSSAAVVAGMMLRFAPSWHPGYMLGALALIALEAGIVHRAYRRGRMWTGELLRYLAPELMVMAVLVRLAITATLAEPLLAAAKRWLTNPLSALDVPFLLAFAVGAIIAGVTHTTMQALRDLQLQEFETSSPRDESAGLLHLLAHDRSEALRGISTRFIIGGVLVLLALGIEAVTIERIGEQGHAVSTGSAIGAFVYLVSGFLLYSQARLALLNTRWQLDGAIVSPLVGKRWARSSWLIIGGVALVALLLPRAYGMGLLDALRAALGIVGYVFALLGYGVLWLFSVLALIPALLLTALSGGMGQGAAVPPLPLPPTLPQVLPTVAGEPNIAGSLVFWLCMLLLAGYAAVTILRRHPLLAERLFLRGPLRHIWGWLRALWYDSARWATLAAGSLQQRLQRPVRVVAPRGPLIRLGALTPRELVRYFYRSTLRRAAAGGLPRKAGQTPIEYSAVLRESLPEAEADIAALTEAFVVANYSPRAIAPAEAQRARSPWQRLRARLRRTVG